MKRKIKTSNIINIIFCALIFIYMLVTLSSYVYLHYTAEKLPNPVPQEFLRIKLYGSSYHSTGNTVSGSFTLIDSNGYELATIERSWSGSYIGIEFLDYDYKGKHYTFPSKVFGKNQIRQEKSESKAGSNLVRYYNINKQCKLFAQGYSNKDRKNFYRLSNYLAKEYPIFDFGQAKIISLDLSSCRTDRYYSIGTNGQGEIYITEI